MKRRLEIIAFIVAAALASSGLQADEPRNEQKQPASGEEPRRPAHQEASVPVYMPPVRGAPGGRIGGGTRGDGRDMLSVSVLAPDHTGLTAVAQPSLYWLITAKSPAPVELTVVDPRASKPVLELRLDKPVDPGVHALRLAEHNVALEPGVSYRWYVAVVRDADRRSRDVLAGGAIERIELAEPVRLKLLSAPSKEKPALFAQAGLWYDALAAISELIDQSPGDATLRRHRAALLEQVGLREPPQ